MRTKILILTLCTLFLLSCTEEKNQPAEPTTANTTSGSNEQKPGYTAKGILEFVNNTKYFVEISSSTYTIGCIIKSYEQETINMQSDWYIKTDISATYYNPNDEDNPVACYVVTQTFEKGKDYRILLKDNMIVCNQITE